MNRDEPPLYARHRHGGGSIDPNGRHGAHDGGLPLEPEPEPALSREEIEATWRRTDAGHVIWLKQASPATIPTATSTTSPGSWPDDGPAPLRERGRRELRGPAGELRYPPGVDRPDGNPDGRRPDAGGGRRRSPAGKLRELTSGTPSLVPVLATPTTRLLLPDSQAFPDREVVGIDCTAMVADSAPSACISQQPSVAPESK